MTILISICIPTYNRPELLQKCLDSILLHMGNVDKVEICISNNNSDAGYGFIDEYADRCRLRYFCQPAQVGIDVNMYTVISMASGEYVLLLGDDDYITKSISDLATFVEQHDPDLLCLSGNHVDMSGNVLAQHLPVLRNGDLSVLDQFEILKYLLPFGSLLIKKSSYDMNIFNSFTGTYHAYASFWLTFLKSYENGAPVSILHYEPQIVALGAALKTYDKYFFDVVGRGIPLYFNLLKNGLVSHEVQEKLNNTLLHYNARLLTLRYTALFISKGTEKSLIIELHKKNNNPRKHIHIFIINNFYTQIAWLISYVHSVKKIFIKYYSKLSNQS